MKIFPACFAIAVAAQCFVSCGGHGSSSSDTVDTLSLRGEVFIDYDHLSLPLSIFTGKDKLYTINRTDTIIEEFDLSGNFVRSFLRRGQGPDEVPRLECPSYSASGNGLYLCYDTGSHYLLNFDPEEPTLTKVFTYDNGQHPEAPENFSMGFEKWILADGTIVTGSQMADGYFAVVDKNGNFVKYAVDNIPESEYGNGLPDYMKYNFVRPIGGTSPDGKHAAWAMGSADMMVFASLEGDSVRFVTKYAAPPSGLKVIVGDGYSSFEYTPDRKTYFASTPALSNNYAYIQRVDMLADDYYSYMRQGAEGECEPHSTVIVYDYEGNPVKVLNLDCMPGPIAVSQDDKTLYVLNEYGDEGMHIKRYNL